MDFCFLKEWLDKEEASEPNEDSLELALLRLSSDDPEQLITDITDKALSKVNVLKYLVFKSPVLKDTKKK